MANASSQRIFNVLFLCTGNSARSILAEAVLSTLGKGRFHAFSAGSMPKGEVHPMALDTLRHYGFPHEGFRSKNWREFEAVDAPCMDFIITVCDNAAGETCPVWPGQPITAHWGIEDPASVSGDAQQQAFVNALTYMRRRIELLVALPDEALEKLDIEQRLQNIGSEQGATARAKEAL